MRAELRLRHITFTPSGSVTPTTSGTPFAVNASGAVGDYFFNVHGVGTDPNTITRDFSLTLQWWILP